MNWWQALTHRPVRRLRTQLLASFALVALVALVAAGSAVVWMMLGYRTQVTEARLRDAGASAGVAALMFERRGEAADDIAAGVAAQVPLSAARVLLLDSTGVVVADEGRSETTRSLPATFVGQRLIVPSLEAPPVAGPSIFRPLPPASPSDRVVVWRTRPSVGPNAYLFVAPEASDRPADRGAPDRGAADRGLPGSSQGALPGGLPDRGSPPFRGYSPANYRIVLAVPTHSLPTAWQELAPGLTAAAAIALFAAAAVAWWLAGSITRPIRAVTRSTERIARGESHRPIPEDGVEEVIQLARGFNTMALEVERTQQTLRDFVADASHELRTPLTAIQGFSQAVVDGVLEAPEPTRDAAGLIQREAERMHRLVEDLLLLSKMEARDRAMTREPVDIAELLDTLTQRVQRMVRDRRLRLVQELPDQILAEGDALQLEHLFGNLLDNAGKYASEGGTVTVRAALDEGHTWVTVTVHNTGSYIPSEDIPHVFDRFYRVDKSRSRAVAGSGLGLAIAREVAERHGGTIRVESDPEAGTTFVVTVPAASLDTVGATRPASGRHAPLPTTWQRLTSAARTGRRA